MCDRFDEMGMQDFGCCQRILEQLDIVNESSNCVSDIDCCQNDQIVWDVDVGLFWSYEYLLYFYVGFRVGLNNSIDIEFSNLQISGLG